MFCRRKKSYTAGQDALDDVLQQRKSRSLETGIGTGYLDVV
jgi:hypothetical protein